MGGYIGPMSFRRKLSEQLKEVCDNKNISAYKIAKATGIAKSTISGMFKAEGPAPRFDTLEKVLTYLGLDVYDFIYDLRDEKDEEVPTYVLAEVRKAWLDSDANKRELLLHLIMDFQNK